MHFQTDRREWPSFPPQASLSNKANIRHVHAALQQHRRVRWCEVVHFEVVVVWSMSCWL